MPVVGFSERSTAASRDINYWFVARMLLIKYKKSLCSVNIISRVAVQSVERKRVLEQSVPNPSVVMFVC